MPGPFPIRQLCAAGLVIAALLALTLPVFAQEPPPALAPPPPAFPQNPPPVPPPLAPGPQGPGPKLTIRPRSLHQGIGLTSKTVAGETVLILTNPIILTVSNPAQPGEILDIEADRAVVWTKGDAEKGLLGLQAPQGDTSREFEFYLSGNVEIRNKTKKETVILRAEQVYYNAARQVALALRGDVEIADPKLQHPLHLKANELRQLGPKYFQAVDGEAFSTALPSDPGLKVVVRNATLEEREVIRRTLLFIPVVDRETGQPVVDDHRIFRGRHVFLALEGLPIFYSPFVQGDTENSLGPLDSISFNYNKIFGFQFFTSFNVYNLLNLEPIPGTRWLFHVDYLTERGPALGTDFYAGGKNIFGITNTYEFLTKAYGIYDRDRDQIGGDRGNTVFIAPGVAVPVTHPKWRGRYTTRFNVQELPAGFSVLGQVSLISDKNFLEQYFQNEFFTGLNQETFLYVKQQRNFWAGTLLAEPGLRGWMTETHWLPKGDAYFVGLSLFDLLTYNMHASAAYAQFRTTREAPFAYSPTDVSRDTGRFDFWNELSLPFSAGPVRLVPYVAGDLAYYTNDITNDDRGRLYGAAGVRGSIPFSRLYRDVHSDLFNLDGIYHKMVLSGNYYFAHSDTRLTRFPQLDRLNDDATDQALRDFRPRQGDFNAANAAFLTTSALFDPQIYALRRLIAGRTETIDSIDVVQLNLRQRLQTKRGFPGNQHIIDWMTLDIGTSIFPHSNRDNFGEHFGIIEYDWVWNVGDRTSFVSNGWFETIDNGPRVITVGVSGNRPNGFSYFYGYRHIDPLNSRAFLTSSSFAFSAKYAMTASSMYDFGTKVRSDSFVLTRIGTDLQMSLGVNYNSILRTFGVTFEVVPILLARARGASSVQGAFLQGRRE